MANTVRLYKTTGESSDLSVKCIWSGTKADARRDRKAMKEDDLSLIETEEIDFPTTKSGLISWLNTNDIGET